MNRSKILSFAIGPIASAIFGFASLPILAWYFSAQDIGRISMLQTVISFAIILFSLGLDQAYVREYHEVSDSPRLLKMVILPGLILLLFALVGIIFYSPQLLSKCLFAIESTLFSAITAFCLIISFLSRFLSLILRMEEKGLAFSMSQVLPKVLFLLIVGGYVLIGALLNFKNLIIAQTLSLLLVLLVFSWNTRMEWQPAITRAIDFQKLKHMLAFGFPLIFGGVASWALMAMDRVFLRSLSSFEELGIYSIATSIAAAAGIFSGIFNTIWAPTVFKWAVAGENLDVIDKVSEHVLAVVYFALCFVGVFSWVIPYLLPNTYMSVQFLVASCVIVPLFYMLSEITAVGIAITRRTSLSLIASFVAAGVNAAGNYWLVPIYGAIGASISTAFAFWVFMICRTEFCCLVWRKTPRLKLYLVTMVCLFSSIFFALAGIKYNLAFIIFWLFLVFIGIYLFKSSVSALKVELSKLLGLV